MVSFATRSLPVLSLEHQSVGIISREDVTRAPNHTSVLEVRQESAHCRTRCVSERPSTDNLTVKTGDSVGWPSRS